MIKYSIITPVYNRQECILRCMESVRNQDSSYSYEHIIINDGSTDNTEDIISNYANNHPYIHFFSFPQNRGVNAARNKAISLSKGKFIIILDSDDYFNDNALKIIDEALNCYPNFKHYLFQADDRIPYYEKNDLLKNGPFQLNFSNWLLRHITGDFIHVINRDTMVKYPFDEEIRIFEGVNFLNYYKENSIQMYIDKIITHRERGRTDSVTLTAALKSKESILRSYRASALRIKLFKEDYLRFGGIDILRKDKDIAMILAISSGEYQDYKKLRNESPANKKYWLDILAKLHMGVFLRYAIILKYKIKKR